MELQSFEVLRGPIALVPVKAVDGVLKMVIGHKAVPVDFCHYGGRRDGNGSLIASCDALLSNGQREAVRAVDE